MEWLVGVTIVNSLLIVWNLIDIHFMKKMLHLVGQKLGWEDSD